MGGNPLDMIIAFVFKIIFGFVLGFVGIFIMIWAGGNIGAGIIAIFSGTFEGFSIEMTSFLLKEAFFFMEAWFPYAWYVFQWVVWLLIGSYTGLFPMPIAPWM